MTFANFDSLLGAAMIAAALSATAQPSAMLAPRAMKLTEKARVEWFGFAAYPRARELCWQSVLGQDAEEILWYSYATQDKPSEVIAFYVKENDNDKRSRRQAERTGNTWTLRRGNRILSVQGAGPDSPQCGSKARAGERTVIVVSRMSGGGER